MNNEDVLAAFAEYLQAQPFRLEIITLPKALAVIDEFAAAIEPVPLGEATLQEIRVFELDRRAALVRNVHLKEIAKLRHIQIRYVMLYFRQFRNSVLKR